jgi:hypothetical protein
MNARAIKWTDPIPIIIIIVLSSILSYGIGWKIMFNVRVSTCENIHRKDYNDDALRAARCKNDAVTLELFNADCERAKAATTHSLEARCHTEVWNASTICGGDTCVSILFGHGESWSMVAIRSALLCVVLAVILFSGYVVLNWLHRWRPNERPQKDRPEYNNKHKPNASGKRKPSVYEENVESSNALVATRSIRHRNVIEDVSDD